MNPQLHLPTEGSLHLGGHTRLSTDDILFCKSDRNYTHVHFRRLPKLTLSVTLRIVHERLGKSKFLRLNRSMVVNKACIAQFGGHEIRLHSGLVIPVSRRRRQFVWLNLQSHIGSILITNYLNSSKGLLMG